MTTGLFLGRFQPFHNGHLEIIKQAFTKVDRLIILIGSAQYSRQPDNPLTANEREEIIQATLLDLGIENCEIIKLDDINSDAEYVGYVEKNIPKFDIVFTGENELNYNLFSEAGYKVERTDRLGGWEATIIRDMIKNNQDWQELVPKKTAEMLENRGLVKVIADNT
ncbi:nicotinamide-nucleotide adenylyltransferase [Nanoarchaeota archaeon]